MSARAPTSTLELLERCAREGLAGRRLEVATRTLEAHPSDPTLHAHRVLATLDLEGVEAARAALADAVKRLAPHGEPLPDLLITAFQAVALRRAMGDAPTVEPAPTARIARLTLEKGGLYRVDFEDGGVTRMSATILERVYGLRVAPGRVVH